MTHRLSITGYLLAGTMLLFAACNQPNNKNHGPIVLGDSSTIVTENDPVALQDMVQDLRPALDVQEAPVAEQPVKDTATTKPAAPETKPEPAPEPVAAQQPAGNGLNIAFKEVTLFIPNITTRSYGRQDLQNARGATFELTGGNLAGNQLRVLNGTVTRVTQRYQSVIGIQKGSEKLPLESLGVYSSEWQPLKGSNSFAITGLDANSLDYIEAGPGAIRNAVQQATRKARMNRASAQEWQNLSRNARTPERAPCTVMLRSVSWRIEGKDAKGRAFNKEVRIDMPR